MKIDELITELNLVQDQNKQVVILFGDVHCRTGSLEM